MTGMRLAGIDHALELRVGQDIGGEQPRRQMWPIRGAGRGDRGHRGRLHELGGVRPRGRDPDRLQRVAFIEARGQTGGTGGRPVAGLVSEFDEIRRGCRALDECKLRRRRFRPSGKPRAQRKHGLGGAGSGSGHQRPGRHQPGDAIEQFGRVGGHAGRGRKSAGVVGRNTVDYRQPRLNARTVADIGAAGDRRGEDDAAFLLQAHKGLAPGRLIRTDIMAGDRDETAALGEPRQRRADVAHRGFGEAAFDMRRGREGRVHQNDTRPDPSIEMVVDLLGVVAGDSDVAEQPAEETGAGLGDLVQGEPGFGQLGEDRQHAGAGRGFEDQVG